MVLDELANTCSCGLPPSLLGDITNEQCLSYTIATQLHLYYI